MADDVMCVACVETCFVLTYVKNMKPGVIVVAQSYIKLNELIIGSYRMHEYVSALRCISQVTKMLLSERRNFARLTRLNGN